jgi:hypothetical protein
MSKFVRVICVGLLPSGFIVQTFKPPGTGFFTKAIRRPSRDHTGSPSFTPELWVMFVAPVPSWFISQMSSSLPVCRTKTILLLSDDQFGVLSVAASLVSRTVLPVETLTIWMWPWSGTPATHIHDVMAVWRPGRLAVRDRIVGQRCLIASVGVHRVELGRRPSAPRKNNSSSIR